MIVEISDGSSVYVRYRIGEQPQHTTLEVGGEGSEALADLNAAGDVIGIEIVDVSIKDAVTRARTFAKERGLPFPIDIEGAARRSAPD